MTLAVRIALALAFAIGVLWMLQGLNLVGGSFMTGQTHWLVIGAAVAIVSLALFLWTLLR